MNVTFEKTKLDYYPEFLRICRENMKEYCEKFMGGWSDSKNEKNFKEFLKSGGVVYAIKIGSTIIGYFSIIVKSIEIPLGNITEHNKIIFINDLQIESKYQGKKIGTKTLEEIEKIGRKYPDVDGLELKVFNSNPAKKLYSRFGFVEIQNEFNGNGVLMRKSF